MCDRGDVGSWVREAAMRALTQTLLLLLTVMTSSDDIISGQLHALVEGVVCALAKQSVERIGRVRAVSNFLSAASIICLNTEHLVDWSCLHLCV